VFSIHEESKLKNLLETLGEKSFRFKQIYQELYSVFVGGFDEITTLSLALRTMLKKESFISSLEKIIEKPSKKDATVKFIFKTQDGHLLETVLMRHLKGRNTVCISCQVGCSVGCKFCSTGKMGLTRSLEFYEIVDQIMEVERFLNKENKKVKNIVFMGMGEPLLNYNNVKKALDIFLSENKLNLSSRHITISTSGIVPGIKKLLEDNYKVNLAFSLHAPNDTLRAEIMPINNSFSLNSVFRELDKYVRKTKRRIFYEYIMIKDLTDTKALAFELAALLRRRSAHVNLIPYNPANNKDEFKRSSKEQLRIFSRILDQRGITNSIRFTLGDDIDAACGQLITKIKSTKVSEC